MLSGRQTLIQEIDALHHRIELHAAAAFNLSSGTLGLHEPGSALFRSPGRGSDRPR